MKNEQPQKKTPKRNEQKPKKGQSLVSASIGTIVISIVFNLFSGAD